MFNLFCLVTTCPCDANGAMNGHGQRNGMALCLLMNPVSACNITMIGFQFEDTVIELLPWPSCSPDLSKFKNVWPMLSQRLARDTAAWTAVPHPYIQSLFDSMSRRVAAVIDNNGSYTNY
ncbi:hypothetical protein TNCV_3644561 [Trichonephila clavipes]|nr:hypothetical protein TNCV_3644561 [Trichonephila clavipes]